MQSPAIMSSIPDFYSGKNILVTGGTGFVGKVLIEKLVRSCPGVKTVYCLIRPRKGLSAAERLANMLKEPVSEIQIS